MDLSSERVSGFGPGPIPWSKVKDYAIAYEYTPEQLDDLYYFVRSLDNTYLRWESNKSDS